MQANLFYTAWPRETQFQDSQSCYRERNKQNHQLAGHWWHTLRQEDLGVPGQPILYSLNGGGYTVLRRQWQVDLCDFSTSLVYILGQTVNIKEDRTFVSKDWLREDQLLQTPSPHSGGLLSSNKCKKKNLSFC